MRLRKAVSLPSRSGVTLIEVLISIFVLAVGLLGMAALLPIGRFELAQAARLDNGSVLGRRSFRDLLVRGYLKPENWLNPTSDVANAPVLRGSGIGSTFQVLNGLSGPPNSPLVIDPLMVFPPGYKPGVTVPSPTHLANVSTFPYGLNGPGASYPADWPEGPNNAPRIARVTLRSIPNVPLLMPHDMASRIFRSNDDLVFTEPFNKDQYPEAVYLEDSRLSVSFTTSNARVVRPAFRQFDGAYSWMVTVAPTLTELIGLDNMGAASQRLSGVAATARQYLVTTVVFHQRPLRDLTNLAAGSAEERKQGERMVWVDWIGGTDARLRVAGAVSKSAAEDMLRVSGNQWIAISGRYEHKGLGSSGMAPSTMVMLSWYRIVSVSPEVIAVPEVDGAYYRDVTLSGRNWTEMGFAFNDAQQFNKYSDRGELPTAYGTIMEGVVGVYEKTMTLDGTSLWSR